MRFPDNHHAHAPGTVAGVGDGRALRRRHLGTDGGREGVAALGLCQQVGRLAQALVTAGATVKALRLRDLDIAIEVITRDVKLDRAHLGHGAIEATTIFRRWASMEQRRTSALASGTVARVRSRKQM